MCNISFKLEPPVFPVIAVVGKHKPRQRQSAGDKAEPGQLRESESESDEIQFSGSTPVKPGVSREGEKLRRVKNSAKC